MTAEIAIINRHAIALAADSAVTIGKERVWKSSNKLFSLGPNNDIAIMVYGAGEFIGYSWEMLIKQFRREKCHECFDKVEDCAKRFIDFLKEERFSPDRDNSILGYSFLLEELEELKDSVEDPSSRSNTKKNLERTIDEWMSRSHKYGEIEEKITFKELEKIHGLIVGQFIKDVFNMPLSKKINLKLKNFIYSIYNSKHKSAYHTGIVFAGYGKREFFPVVSEYIMDGKIKNHARFWRNRFFDSNLENSAKTIIIPFAQSDIAQLFMEGINRQYVEFLEHYIKGVLSEKSKQIIQNFVGDPDEAFVETNIQKKENEKIVENIMKEFSNYRKEKTIDPILSVVEALPKEEMGEMAKSIVELTSLRRKVDSNLETVGGPVDVAVISKGDGFVWIDRKHYFREDKNFDFKIRKSMIQKGDL